MAIRTGSRRAVAATSLLALGLSPLAFASSAQAAAKPATVSIDGQDLTYQAAGGQANRLTVTMTTKGVDDDSPYGSSEYTYTIDDSVKIRTTSDKCSYPKSSDRTLIVCTFVVEDGQDPGYVGTFKLGDKNDTVKFVNPTGETYGPNKWYLGTGSDTYTSATYTDGGWIDAGTGNDTVTVDRMGGDLTGIHGGKGDDTLRVKAGDAWSVTGDAGNDKIYGGTGSQSLSGGDGNDLVKGGSGRDTLYGGKGNDTLYGNSGADTIYGNSGNDKLYGGPGTDNLFGGAGQDVIKQN